MLAQSRDSQLLPRRRAVRPRSPCARRTPGRCPRTHRACYAVAPPSMARQISNEWFHGTVGDFFLYYLKTPKHMLFCIVHLFAMHLIATHLFLLSQQSSQRWITKATYLHVYPPELGLESDPEESSIAPLLDRVIPMHPPILLFYS